MAWLEGRRLIKVWILGVLGVLWAPCCLGGGQVILSQTILYSSIEAQPGKHALSLSHETKVFTSAHEHRTVRPRLQKAAALSHSTQACDYEIFCICFQLTLFALCMLVYVHTPDAHADTQQQQSTPLLTGRGGRKLQQDVSPLPSLSLIHISEPTRPY